MSQRSAQLKTLPLPSLTIFHPPMSPPFVSLSLFVFFLLPFFSSIRYQEGQPVEAQGSTVPNQQALEAAAAATVSGFKNHLMDLYRINKRAWNAPEFHKWMTTAPLGWKSKVQQSWCILEELPGCWIIVTHAQNAGTLLCRSVAEITTCRAAQEYLAATSPPS